jgi:RNA polymerase sigma-70 factor, ECF subfamily
MPSTADLVQAARRGDKAAFAQLVGLYQRAAIITAQSVLRDFDLAQDAAQDGFVVAYTKLKQLQADAAFGPWLLQIVHRRAQKMLRLTRNNNVPRGTAAEPAHKSNDWTERYQEVIEQVGHLPEHERLVIVLRYVDGHSLQQVCDATGRRMDTIKKQLSRGLARLRKWFTEVPS